MQLGSLTARRCGAETISLIKHITFMGILSFLFGSSAKAKEPMSKGPEPGKQEPDDKAEGAGRSLRQMMFEMKPAELGARPSEEFPRVYGILMDLPIAEHTATVFSSSTGAASLYTTSAFGIIGGEGHESVRAASIRFVRAADALFDAAKPVSQYPYPDGNRVRFHLLTYDGVRMLEANLETIETEKGSASDVFFLGNAVLTELRRVSEN